MVLPEPGSWDSAVEAGTPSEGLSGRSWNQRGDSVDASNVTGDSEEERNALTSLFSLPSSLPSSPPLA